MIFTTNRKPQIGDVFGVPLDGATCGYFHFVAIDSSQLESHVIRVFQGVYDTKSDVDIEKVVQGVVAFHAHVFLKIGLKQKCWEKAGHSNNIGQVDVLFRDSDDYGNPQIKVSHAWYVWRINEEFKFIGELAKKYQHAEIGIVMTPDDIIHRMRNGVYDGFYPEY